MNCATNRDRLNHRVKSRASWKCVLKKLCFSFEFHIISSEQIIILASMECLPRWQCAWGWQTDLSHDMKITSETLKSWWNPSGCESGLYAVAYVLVHGTPNTWKFMDSIHLKACIHSGQSQLWIKCPLMKTHIWSVLFLRIWTINRRGKHLFAAVDPESFRVLQCKAVLRSRWIKEWWNHLS